MQVIGFQDKIDSFNTELDKGLFTFYVQSFKNNHNSTVQTPQSKIKQQKPISPASNQINNLAQLSNIQIKLKKQAYRKTFIRRNLKDSPTSVKQRSGNKFINSNNIICQQLQKNTELSKHKQKQKYPISIKRQFLSFWEIQKDQKQLQKFLLDNTLSPKHTKTYLKTPSFKQQKYQIKRQSHLQNHNLNNTKQLKKLKKISDATEDKTKMLEINRINARSINQYRRHKTEQEQQIQQPYTTTQSQTIIPFSNKSFTCNYTTNAKQMLLNKIITINDLNALTDIKTPKLKSCYFPICQEILSKEKRQLPPIHNLDRNSQKKQSIEGIQRFILNKTNPNNEKKEINKKSIKIQNDMNEKIYQSLKCRQKDKRLHTQNLSGLIQKRSYMNTPFNPYPSSSMYHYSAAQNPQKFQSMNAVSFSNKHSQQVYDNKKSNLLKKPLYLPPQYRKNNFYGFSPKRNSNKYIKTSKHHYQQGLKQLKQNSSKQIILNRIGNFKQQQKQALSRMGEYKINIKKIMKSKLQHDKILLGLIEKVKKRYETV